MLIVNSQWRFRLLLRRVRFEFRTYIQSEIIFAACFVAFPAHILTKYHFLFSCGLIYNRDEFLTLNF